MIMWLLSNAHKTLKPFATKGCVHVYALEKGSAQKGNVYALRGIMERTAAKKYDLN
jgi:hypothetical protein